MLDAHPEKNLKKVAKDSGIPYYTLYRFSKEQCSIFDVEQAGLLFRYLTGQPLIAEVGA